MTNSNATTVLFSGDKLRIDSSGSHFKESFTTEELAFLMKEFDSVVVKEKSEENQYWILILAAIVIVTAVAGIAVALLRRKKIVTPTDGSTTKKFCRICGFPNKSSSKFCGKCGTMVRQTVPPNLSN